VKLSVSLPDDDVVFLDAFARKQGFASRSAVLHTAVRMLRGSELGPSYEGAFAEWEEGGDDAAWDVIVADGVGPDAPR
jgi:Arc/MetJ-type ribon-helix-helix transcriptional regulator